MKTYKPAAITDPASIVQTASYSWDICTVFRTGLSWPARPIDHRAVYRAGCREWLTGDDRRLTVDRTTHRRRRLVLSTTDRRLSIVYHTRWRLVGRSKL